jgi:predicted extracellular nuclease
MLTRNISFLFILSAFVMGCSDTAYKLQNDGFLLGLEESTEKSTVEGNLVSTAIKEVHDLDIVLYPSRLIENNNLALLNSKGPETQKQSILTMFPKGIKDQFIIGHMSGKQIMNFIQERSSDKFEVDLQVAGMRYHIHYTGGWPDYSYFSLDRGRDFDKEKVYRVALSKYYYFSGETFPSYKYRNGLWISNFKEDELISARDSLKQYLTSSREWPFLRTPRAKVTKGLLDNLGMMSIPNIQGRSHRSKFMGHKVSTRGVVTAQGTLDRYPGGEEAYIQDPYGDGDPKTSDGLHLHYRLNNLVLEIGDYVEVKGVVYEQKFNAGLSRTGLREITSIKIIKKNQPLPAPEVLGKNGRSIPKKVFSNWNGNLNNKPELELDEAIDFWESLEGMRVQIQNPRIVGFRGGNEEFYRQRPKGYLTLYVLADGKQASYKNTPVGGIAIDGPKNDFNPQIMQIISNHFTDGIETDAYYDVGGQVNGKVQGVMGYESNLFGGGEFAMMITEPQTSLDDFVSENQTRTELAQRPITHLQSSEKQLTVAAFNIENLAGFQDDRIREIGTSLSLNLRCPDIVSLVEVQDGNGTDFRGSSSPKDTLDKIILATDCPQVNYRPIYVAPFIGDDGGQPGGNIQVAFLYDANRVGFSARGEVSALMDNFLTSSGDLLNNPSRLYTRHTDFSRTRKSFIAQFRFRGEKIFVMANHLNSKFGDTSFWGAQQPVYFESENERRRLAKLLNNFMVNLKRQSPDGHLIALGDFNAFAHEDSMKIFAGRVLKNLAFDLNLLPFNQRYTYNYNGNSQAIDHIFVGKNLLRKKPEVDIPHVNTDYMGRIADHDPIISRFTFD